MQTSSIAQIRVEQISLAPKVFLANKAYADQHPDTFLLKDLTFSVVRGEFIAVVGPSGAGKTSLLRLLNRLSEPTSGTIYLDNVAYKQRHPVELRQQIVLVPQESKLLGMTVQQALEYPLTLQQLPKQTIQQRVSEWIDRLNLPLDWLSRTELQLSVGQRQLVAIARALIMQPQVLLLDEPTSALDLGRAVRVLTLLKEMTQADQLTVMMANHQLELAQQFCTRVLHLQAGMISQDIPNEQMDWDGLQRSLIQAEAQRKAEWGDD